MTNVSAMTFKSTGAIASRSLGDLFAETVNVKDFGATGDGSTDDKAAIQAAIDYAFGTAVLPNGDTNKRLNRRVFFPNGTYNISGPIVLTAVIGPAIFGAGKFATRIVNTATSGALYYGAVFLSHGLSYFSLENMTVVAANPAGSSVTAAIAGATLTVTAAPSGTVAVGQLVNATGIADGTLISALGTGTGGTGTYTVSVSQTLSSRSMTTSTANRGVNLAWDGTGPVALNQHTYRNVRFEGGDIGIGIGDGGFMGSELTFLGCDFVNCAIGMKGFNFNALDFTMIGCSYTGCGTGITCNGTSTFSYLSGCNFSGSTSQDILFDSFDGMVVEACSSTSMMFQKLIGSVPMHNKACSHTPASAGEYAVCQAYLVMDGCLVTNAVLQNAHSLAGNALYMRGCSLPGTFISGSTNVPTIKENI